MLKRDPKKLFLRYAQKGDAAALGRVFDLLAPELLGLALHLTRRIELAEDVLQDTFLVAAESASRFDPSREFHPWIIGILVNRARKVRESIASSRLRAVGDERLAASSHDGRGRGSENPGKEAEATEVRTRVAAAIRSLSAPYREVVDAHLTEGLPPRDIAPTLGRPPGTVRVQLHRGLEQLREVLVSREGIAGLEMLSLAPTSALMLSGEMGRGLAAVKVDVLASLPAGASGVAGATGGGAGGSVLAVAAVATVLGGGAWIAMQLGATGPGGRPDVAGMEPVDRDASLSSPALAAVENWERNATGEADSSSMESRRERSVTSSPSSDAAAKTGSAASTAIEPPPARKERLLFRIEPSIDRTGLQQFGAFDTCRFHARSSDRLHFLGAGQAVFNDFRDFSLGTFESPQDLPQPLIVHFDHPGALPCEVAVSQHDWFSESGGYVARPIMRLDNVDHIIRVAAGTTEKSPFTPAISFQGEVLLMNFGAGAVPQVFDRQPLGGSGHKLASLRAPSSLGRAYVVGIPESPDLFADSAEVAAAPEAHGQKSEKSKRPSLRMHPRALPPISFKVEGPFGAPMANLELRAVVPNEVILAKDFATGDPILFEGRVFCACDERQIRRYGESSSRRRAVSAYAASTDPAKITRAKLLAVTYRIERATGQSGIVTLGGAVRGLHRLEAKSPFTGAWEALETDSSWALTSLSQGPMAGTSTYRLRGPAAGLEIECPADLVARPESWNTAKITIASGAFEASIQPKGSPRARVLVPPDSMLNVRVQVGDQVYTAFSQGLLSGQSQRLVPVRIQQRERSAGRAAGPEDPEENPEEDSKTQRR